jgi:hypothetical protein
LNFEEKKEDFMTKIKACFTIFLLLSFWLVFGAQETEKKMPGKVIEKGVQQAFPERMPGTFDPAQYLQEQEAKNTWLISEAAPLSPAAIITIHVSDKEIAEIDEYNRLACGEEVSQKIRVGIVKPVGLTIDLSGLKPESLTNSGQFLANGMMRTTSAGGVVWTAALESEKARGLRVHFTHVNLPENAALYIYNMRGEAFGPYTGTYLNNNGEFWSHTVIGSTAFVQLHIAGPVSPGIMQTTRFVIQDIGFLNDQFLSALRGESRTPEEGIDQPMVHCPQNAWCIEDASCFDSDDWAFIDDAKLSVARMQYVKLPYLYLCSGGLVADTDPNTFIPYFLTANHCIEELTDPGTIECFWRYWTAYCHAPCYSPAGVVPSTVGAQILSTSSVADYCFLRLNEDPPAGSVMMGWLTEAVYNQQPYYLYRISHPKGSPQAFSMHNIDPYSPQCTGWLRPNWIYSKDIIGATENGSSGSPVFNEEGQIVGQLSGACGYHIEDPCDSVNNWTVDGAFAAYSNQIMGWLDPLYPPSNLRAVPVACNAVNLYWNDMSYNEDRFVIERSSDGTTFNQIAVAAAGSTFFRDGGLEQETTYSYRVKACKEDRCSDYSNVASATTFGPPYPPTDLKAELTGEYEITLKWKYENAIPPITAKSAANTNGFHVYRALHHPASWSNKLEFVLIAELRPGTTQYVDREISPGYQHYYKVCAFHACSETCSEIVHVDVQ